MGGCCVMEKESTLTGVAIPPGQCPCKSKPFISKLLSHIHCRSSFDAINL